MENPVDTVIKLHYYLDERRYEDILDLFVEDGKWFRKEKWRVGRTDILASLNERPATQVVRHVLTNSHVARQETNSVTVVSYMLSYTFDDGQLHQGPLPLAGPSKLFTLSSDLVAKGGRWMLTSQSSKLVFTFSGK